MKHLRKSLVGLLCVMLSFSLTGMGIADEPAFNEPEEVSLADAQEEFILADVSADSEEAVPTASEEKITLDANKGTLDQTTVTLVEGKLPALPTPSRTGWIFKGWYTAAVTENYWGDEEGETLDALKAKYPGLTDEEARKKTFTWFIESEGKAVAAGEVLDAGVTTLYAMYEPTTVQVVWHYNGWMKENGVLLTDTKKQIDSPLAPAKLTDWEGRTFQGWFTAPEGGEQWVFDRKVNDYMLSTRLVTEELHLYARWSGGPEATALSISPLSSHVEPGETVKVSANYSPAGANIPKVTWSTSDSDLVTVTSTDGLTATFTVSKDADVVNGNKQVTIIARTEQGVTATAEITICHDWNNGSYVKQPTCTGTGIVRYTCKKCKKTRDVTVSANGHYFSVKNVPATCTDAGYVERICRTCGLIEKEITAAALGHSWYTESVIGCGGRVTTTTCRNCGLTTVESDVNDAQHAWETKPTVDKAPTCTTAGSQSYHCRNCDLTKDSSVIPADPSLHTWSVWIVVTPATATDFGEDVRLCTTCGMEERRTTEPIGSGIPDLNPDTNPTPGAGADDTSSLPESKADMSTVNTLINAVQKLRDSSNPADKVLLDAIRAAEKEGKTITAEVVVMPSTVPAGNSKFTALFDGGELRYVAIDIVVKADGEPLGYIAETEDVLTFRMALSEAGSGKIVCVLREHEGSVEFLPCRVDGDTVYFSTDKFSVFAVGSTNDISYASVDAIADQTYTGTEIKPAVYVTINGGEKLVEGVDYTVAYRNNVNAGTATAVITGIGDFAGSTKEVSFNIVKEGEESKSEPATQTNAKNLVSPKTGDNEMGTAFLVILLAVCGIGLSLVMLRKDKA